jgi:putative two-component system response regulator
MLPAPRSPGEAQTDARVLIVEDEPGIRNPLARYLARTGTIVHTAATVPEALAAVQGDRFHTVVVDLRLPGGSGLEVLAEVRRRDPETRLILMSGSADVEAVSAAVAQGIEALVTKPFGLADMAARVNEAVARHRAAQAALQERQILEARVRQRDTESKLWILRAAHALAHAVEAKDPYTAGHAHRVTGYALRMAEGNGAIDLERFRLAGKLHDVGKIGVPDAVLNKPGCLTAEERAIVRRHPEAGARILEPLIDDPLVIGVVRWHHEAWDGSGYPDGLRGTAVPLPARILTVADTLDAMTSHRSYRRALSWDAAVAEIRRGSGTQFDPDVVGLFDSVLPMLEAQHLAYCKAAGDDRPAETGGMS